MMSRKSIFMENNRIRTNIHQIFTQVIVMGFVYENVFEIEIEISSVGEKKCVETYLMLILLCNIFGYPSY